MAIKLIIASNHPIDPNVFIEKLMVKDHPTISFKMFENDLDCWTKFSIRANKIAEELQKLKINEYDVPDMPVYSNESILEYLKPLVEHIRYFDSENIKIIADAWETFGTLKFWSKLPNWVYTNEVDECDSDVMKPVLRRWIEKNNPGNRCGGINMWPLFNVIQLFQKYGTNIMPVVELLNKEYTELRHLVDFDEKRLHEEIKEINTSIQLQNRIDNGATLEEIANDIQNGIYDVFNDQLSMIIMKAMEVAINETEGAKQWFIDDGDYMSESEVWKKLQYHPEVEACGHTGMSMSWVVVQYRDIFRNGKNKWILRALISRGVGWNKITFDEAIDIESEKCAVYHFKSMSEGKKEKLMSKEEFEGRKEKLMATMIEYDWGKLCEVILEQCGMYLTVEEYFGYEKTTNELKKWSVNHIIINYWNKFHSRTVDFTGMRYEDVARSIWIKMPYDLYEKEKPIPTDEEINADKYDLNGKWIHSIISREKYPLLDSLYFNRELNDPFALQNLRHLIVSL